MAKTITTTTWNDEKTNERVHVDVELESGMRNEQERTENVQDLLDCDS